MADSEALLDLLTTLDEWLAAACGPLGAQSPALMLCVLLSAGAMQPTLRRLLEPTPFLSSFSRLSASFSNLSAAMVASCCECCSDVRATKRACSGRPMKKKFVGLLGIKDE